MLNTEQRKQFAHLTAEYNTGWNGDADDSAALCEPERVVETQDALDSFITVWGQPAEVEQGMYVWESIQRKKGETRGTLFVMDFGEIRGVYFAN